MVSVVAELELAVVQAVEPVVELVLDLVQVPELELVQVQVLALESLGSAAAAAGLHQSSRHWTAVAVVVVAAALELAPELVVLAELEQVLVVGAVRSWLAEVGLVVE